MQKPLFRCLPTLAALGALALAGCGSGASSASNSPTAHDHGSHSASAGTETDDASPRIVAATDTGLVVLDEKLQQLASFETKERPTLTLGHDARHIFAVQGAANLVNVLDSGSWAQGHGDHFHYYVSDPAMATDGLEGGKPVHVVPNPDAEATAVFFDEQGTAVVLDTAELAEGHFDHATRIATKGAQHGLVVPLRDGQRLVTQPGSATTMPDSIEWQDGDGTTKQTYTCTQMHGEVVAGGKVAFGCADQVLIIGKDGQATKIAAPDASGERVGALVADPKGKTFLGDWGSTSLLFINGEQAKVVEVGVTYGNRAATPDGRFVLLGTDGVLRVFDAAGTETQRFEVTKPWELPKGHGGTMPTVAAGQLQGATMVWVSEPGANKVHAVDLFSNTVTAADVPGAPASLVAANAG